MTHQGREGGVITETPTWITPATPDRSHVFTWGAHVMGLKYVAVECKKNTWSMVRFIGANKPQIYQVQGRLASDTQQAEIHGWYVKVTPGNNLTSDTVKKITVKSEWTLSKVAQVSAGYTSDDQWKNPKLNGNVSGRGGIAYYNLEPRIVINIPQWGENITY